jgi:hypothetical protein
MSGEADSTPAEPKTADEMRAEFRTAQRRRLTVQGVVFWRDTELPDRGVMWTQLPRRDQVD